jgi:hypothetical protein
MASMTAVTPITSSTPAAGNAGSSFTHSVSAQQTFATPSFQGAATTQFGQPSAAGPGLPAAQAGGVRVGATTQPPDPAIMQHAGVRNLIKINPSLAGLIRKHPGVAKFLEANKDAIFVPPSAATAGAPKPSEVTWHIYGHDSLTDEQQAADIIVIFADGAAYKGQSVKFGQKAYQGQIIFVGREGDLPGRTRPELDDDMVSAAEIARLEAEAKRQGKPVCEVAKTGCYSDTPVSFPIYGAATIKYVRDPFNQQGGMATSGGWPEGYTGRNATIPATHAAYEIEIPDMKDPSVTEKLKTAPRRSW